MKHVAMIILLTLLLAGCRTIYHREQTMSCKDPMTTVGAARTVTTQLCAFVDVICYDEEAQNCTVDWGTLHQKLCMTLSDVPGKICKTDNEMPQYTMQ